MVIPTVLHSTHKVLSKLPLRLVLTLPFVGQTVGVVTLVGYLSYRSGQQAVGDIARQLMREKGDRIVQNLEYYLKAPKNLVRENQSAIKLRILDWQNTSLMQTYFTQQLKIHTDVSGLMITTQRKDFLAVGRPHPNQFVIRQRNLKTGTLENYAADLQGNRLYLQDNLPNYDPHADPPTNPWYGAAKKSQEGFWQLVVSLVRGKDEPILMMAYFLPFADSQGEFQGVLSSSVYLDRFGEFLRSLRIGKTGQAFIIDEKGLLIATSTTEAPFRWKRSIKAKETLPPEVLRLAAQDSQNRVTRTAAAWSLNQRNDLDKDSHLRGFRLQNQQYFRRIIPFQLDDHIRWTIVVVVPESDFMPEIQANVYRTVMLCGLALLGAIGSGIWTSKRMTRSLFRLTQATQTVAAGTLDVPLPSTRIAEVENLTASFRQMMIELQQANQLRQNYAQELERQVAEKTALLNEALNVAKIGTWSWNLVSDERWWSPQMYQIVGLNPDEYSAPPDVEITNQNIHPEDRERVNQITRDALEQGISYEIEFRFLRPDGSITYAFSRGLVERDSEGQVTRFWGISQDISERKRAEQALIESEARFQAFMNNSPLLAWISDGDGKLLYCNRSVELWSKRAASELIGETIKALHPTNISQQHLENIHYVINTRQVLETNESAFCSDGTLHEFLSYKFPLINANGQCLVGGIAADITDLEKSEERLQLVLDASELGLWDWNIATGQTYFDSSWKKMLGYEVDEIENSYQSWVKLLHPEDFPRISEALTGYLEGRLPIYEVELRMLTKSGDWKWILGHGKVSERDASGKPLRMIGTQKDIHARKLAEAALQESKEQLQLALEGSGDGFWDWNIQTGEVYYSPRYLEMLGYEADELPEDFRTWEESIHPDDKPWVMETLNAHFADSSVPYKFDYRLLTKSGEPKWIANYGKVVARDENGAPLRMTGTHRDVSDKKLTEIQLQQAANAAEAANRAKSQFLANMSHELRTPLNGILGYAQILQRDKNFAPKQKEGLGIIQQCGEHLLTLINDILDLSKIEAEKLELHSDDFNFPAFLQGIFEIFRLKAAQKSIHLIYRVSDQLPTTVHTDEKRLRQILINLLSNAVKFTDRGSVTFKVEILENEEANPDSLIQNPKSISAAARSAIQNQLVRFQIEDTGIGITSEQLKKIFLPFEQVGESSRQSEGTGLGLAITEKLVSLMGSQIFVESTLGVGSRFWFDLDLPVPSNLIESIPIKSDDNIIGYEGQKRKILVVDDRWENCAVIINILQPIGFELFQAANGQEGLEKAIECQPDLIITDLVMPVMDGNQMTKHLRQLPQFKDTIILAISANAFDADRKKSLESGCNDFLPKPIQAQELLITIKDYLNLLWIYDKLDDTRSQEPGNEFMYYSENTGTELVIPPIAELAILYKAALISHIEGIQQEAIRFKQLDPTYTPFASRVLELAENFDSERIIELVAPFFSKERQ